MSKDEKRLQEELTRYRDAETEAMSMLPSGIISYAIDEVGNLFGWNPAADEIREAAEHIEEATAEAIAAGDYNGRRNNTWDPRAWGNA